MLCNICGKEMVQRNGKRGVFLACSGYPECKHTEPIGGDTPKTPQDSFKGTNSAKSSPNTLNSKYSPLALEFGKVMLQGKAGLISAEQVDLLLTNLTEKLK